MTFRSPFKTGAVKRFLKRRSHFLKFLSREAVVSPDVNKPQVTSHATSTSAPTTEHYIVLDNETSPLYDPKSDQSNLDQVIRPPSPAATDISARSSSDAQCLLNPFEQTAYDPLPKETSDDPERSDSADVLDQTGEIGTVAELKDYTSKSSSSNLSHTQNQGPIKVYRGIKGHRYRVNIKLPGRNAKQNNPWLWALPDTGSGPNCIFRSVLEEFLPNHTYYYDRPKKITGINGGSINSIGRVTMHFSFGENPAEYTAIFEVLENPEEGERPNWDVLIGVHILLDNGLVTFTGLGDSFFLDDEKRHSGTVVEFR